MIINTVDLTWDGKILKFIAENFESLFVVACILLLFLIVYLIKDKLK